MLIVSERNQPVILDSIYTPTTNEYFWVLDFNQMDYMLAPLLVLTETVCPTIFLRISGFNFPVPADWNILVYSEETHQLDVVEVSSAVGQEFTALVYGATATDPRPAVITAVDYQAEYVNVSPSLNKNQMLCHPIGPSEWINVAPSDSYNKYLRDRSVGDLIG